ncbi:hypothetical protein JVU11DRAFT_10132 [Chiua virens]|nr:hypothetical protein JVU11DRAFT_10132 [Chiua virens]
MCSLGIHDSLQEPHRERARLQNLQTLHIDAHGGTWTEWTLLYRDFSNLLTRSGCSLRHLSIRDVEFPDDELVRGLAPSPTLTSFCFIPNRRLHNISDVIRKLDVSRTPSGALNRSGTLDTERRGGDTDTRATLA